jgi:hypothetical protein
VAARVLDLTPRRPLRSVEQLPAGAAFPTLNLEAGGVDALVSTSRSLANAQAIKVAGRTRRPSLPGGPRGDAAALPDEGKDEPLEVRATSASWVKIRSGRATGTTAAPPQRQVPHQ